jgi:predicted tellurium resistance membrane protein TerC
MLIPEDEEKHLDGHTQLWAAIKTIIVADFIMSLDNVLGVAAAAKGSVVMLVLGLAISIPLIIYGSTLILKLMNRWPIIITIGGGILGWVAGEMAITDPVVAPWVEANAHWMDTAAPIVGAVLVVAVGKWFESRKIAEKTHATA